MRAPVTFSLPTNNCFLVQKVSKSLKNCMEQLIMFKNNNFYQRTIKTRQLKKAMPHLIRRIWTISAKKMLKLNCIVVACVIFCVMMIFISSQICTIPDPLSDQSKEEKHIQSPSKRATGIKNIAGIKGIYFIHQIKRKYKK